MESRKKFLSCLPASALFEIQNRLNETRFLGVSLGDTLTNFLCIYRDSEIPFNRTVALRATLGWIRLCCLGLRYNAPQPKLESGRLLLTWLMDTPRFNDLVSPVIAEFNPEQCNVISNAPSICLQLDPAIGFCTVASVFRDADRKSWWREYSRCHPSWHRSLRLWIAQYHLPRCSFPPLAYMLAVHSWHVWCFGKFLDALQPTALLTESEHAFPWSCLIPAARMIGIPTITMMHGVMNPPYGGTPLLSDVGLCWGQQQVEQMIDMGTKPGRLVVTGCQRLTREVSADRGEVCARLGLPPKRPVVMLATEDMPMEAYRMLVFTFAEAFQNHTGLIGVVRLHASEKLDRYQAEITRYPSIRFLENHQWTVEEAMAACDVVVVQNSGLGNDALVMGRPVVLLDDFPSSPLRNGRVLADKAGCPIVRSVSELRIVVDRLLADTEYRMTLKRNAEKYVGYFCAAFGRDAARKVAAEVRKRVRPRQVTAAENACTETRRG